MAPVSRQQAAQLPHECPLGHLLDTRIEEITELTACLREVKCEIQRLREDTSKANTLYERMAKSEQDRESIHGRIAQNDNRIDSIVTGLRWSFGISVSCILSIAAMLLSNFHVK